MRVAPEQLKAFLQDAGILSAKEFEAYQKKAKETGQHLDELLLAEGLISQEDLSKLKAYILGIPFINLENQKIDPEVLKIIPEPIVRHHNIVAYNKKGNVLEVAMLDPDDLRTIEFIKKKAGLKILPRLTTINSIKNALRQYQEDLETEFKYIISQDTKDISTKALPEVETIGEPKDLRKQAQELPIIRIVDTLIKHAILQRASDIHIEPTEKEVQIRYRIDGILRDAMTLPKQVASGIVARIKVLSNLKLDEHRLPQDGRFKIETEDYKYSARVSVMPVMEGEKVVLRLLPETAQTFSLESLGLRDQALELVQDNLKKPVGMILVTGPTGCGKTTTLYTMIEMLNDPSVNICTTEDPIEYRIPRVNQTQINPKIGLTFAESLRALMRQDPDIIMVGEIRDKETASLAVNAALTGHLVLSTLHTNSAAGAIPRLIDMGVEPFLLASTLNLIIAQRLVRRLCEEKEKYRLSLAQIENLDRGYNLKKIFDEIKKDPTIFPGKTIPKSLEALDFYRPKPSKECQEGYKGRIGIFEVLAVTSTIKELIVLRSSADKIQEQAKKEGMRTMAEDGFIKAIQGITSLEEVLRATSED